MWGILAILMWIFDFKNEREGYEMDKRRDDMRKRTVNAKARDFKDF